MIVSVLVASALLSPSAEFAKYHERITGKLPADGLVTFAVDPKVSASGRDAYLITSQEKGARIVGSNERSVWYGLYDLLERRGGCRWFWDGDVVPKKASLDLSGLDVREESQFEYRGLRYFAHRGLTRFQAEHWGFEDWKREIDWCAKRRLNFMMLRIGMDDAFQRAYPDIVDYPDPAKPLPEAMKGYNNRSLFWSLQFRGKLRKQVMDYAFSRGLMQPEDFGTMSHWYSRTPKEFLAKMDPPFLPQQGGCYGDPTDRVWDIRDPKWLDAYWRLTEAMIGAYGRPDLLHTIGLGERMCFTNRAENLAMKIGTIRKLDNLAKSHYPDSKVLLAGWDFYSTWRPEEVRALVAQLNPKRTVLFDYEADSNDGGCFTGKDVKANNFTEWGVVGRFPYTFGIFLCYESGLDVRANYRLIRERQRLIQDDPFCRGYVFWPESSHTDTLLLEYFAQNAWRARETDIDTLIDRFCADRYGPLAASFASVWKKVVPVSCQRGWGGAYGALFLLTDPSADDGWQVLEKNGSLSAWERNQPAADAAFAALADIPWEGDFVRRDTIDLARTVLDRAITLRFHQLNRDFRCWCEGRRDGADLPVRARQLASLAVKMADILALHTDYSLWESLERLDAVEKIRNPDFPKVLFDNASCGYCRSHQVELARHWYAPRAAAYADAMATAVGKGDRQAKLEIGDAEALRRELMNRPLEDLKPTSPRTAEAFARVMRETVHVLER